jgi:hypothetical protein
LITTVESLASLASQVIDGADGSFETITGYCGFDIIQSAGNLVSQSEKGSVEGINSCQFLLVDLYCIEETGITVRGILYPVRKGA